MHSIEDDAIGVREIFSVTCTDVVGVEVGFVISSDDEHVISRSSVGEMAVS